MTTADSQLNTNRQVYCVCACTRGNNFADHSFPNPNNIKESQQIVDLIKQSCDRNTNIWQECAAGSLKLFLGLHWCCQSVKCAKISFRFPIVGVVFLLFSILVRQKIIRIFPEFSRESWLSLNCVPAISQPVRGNLKTLQHSHGRRWLWPSCLLSATPLGLWPL